MRNVIIFVVFAMGITLSFVAGRTCYEKGLDRGRDAFRGQLNSCYVRSGYSSIAENISYCWFAYGLNVDDKKEVEK